MNERFCLFKIAPEIPSYKQDILEILSPKDNNNCSLCDFMRALLKDAPTKDEIAYAVEIFLKIKDTDEVLEETSLSIYPHILNNQTYKQAVIDHINKSGNREYR